MSETPEQNQPEQEWLNDMYSFLEESTENENLLRDARKTLGISEPGDEEDSTAASHQGNGETITAEQLSEQQWREWSANVAEHLWAGNLHRVHEALENTPTAQAYLIIRELGRIAQVLNHWYINGSIVTEKAPEVTPLHHFGFAQRPGLWRFNGMRPGVTGTGPFYVGPSSDGDDTLPWLSMKYIALPDNPFKTCLFEADDTAQKASRLAVTLYNSAVVYDADNMASQMTVVLQDMPERPEMTNHPLYSAAMRQFAEVLIAMVNLLVLTGMFVRLHHPTLQGTSWDPKVWEFAYNFIVDKDATAFGW